ncbi:MAG TPA: hypothetical protein VLA37_14480 [Sphingomonadaceae bacterium]|nr:hypothetical protein [Sphingomonadaceae bacterium]
MEKSAIGRTVYPKVGVWFREDTGHIHLAIEGQGFSTVNIDAGSKRGHPHLFKKLARMLRDAGARHPEIDD